MDIQGPITSTIELNLPRPKTWGDDQAPIKPKTPALWFADKFPDQVKQFGSPFLEMRETNCNGFALVTPIAPNIDFFAAMLGGDSGLGHSIVYFEPEMQFYYREPVLQLYKPVSPEKLQNYYRAMLIRCAQELNNETSKINLVGEFRSDKIAKAVVNRAKSVLAADHTFFSATSPNQRIKGIELWERLAIKFVETMLEPRPGACLTVTQAYQLFCELAQQRNLLPLPRVRFKEMMSDLMRDRFNICMRRDVLNEVQKQQEGWKGIGTMEFRALAA